METKNDTALIKILEAGKATEFWGTMLAVMHENVKFLEQQIITKTSLERGHEGEPLSDEEVDILRYKRSAMKDLMESPDALIKQLTRQHVPTEELDPYYTDVDELRKEA